MQLHCSLQPWLLVIFLFRGSDVISRSILFFKMLHFPPLSKYTYFYMLLFQPHVNCNFVGIRKSDERDMEWQCSESCLFSQAVGQVPQQPSAFRYSMSQEQRRSGHHCVSSPRCIIDCGDEQMGFYWFLILLFYVSITLSIVANKLRMKTYWTMKVLHSVIVLE